jgi:transposase-like protein
MQQEPIDLLELQNKFGTEEACLDHLFRLRWPEGYTCPRCGSKRHYFHSTRKLYQCAECEYQVSLTAGTIFHKTRTPLKHWFWMIFLMVRQRSGVSMLSLQRMLGMKCYKTVWTMGQKIRKAMADRDAQYQLGGLVEMDEGFFGPTKSGKRGRGAQGKATMMVTVENRGEHPGFCAMSHIPNASGEEILLVAREHIKTDSEIRTDGWRAYRILDSNHFKHEEVVLSHDKKAIKDLRWVHTMLANIKGNLRGVCHGVSSKHLKRYAAEFCYRFNRRFWDSQLFNRTLHACLATNTITLTELRS